MKGLLKYWLPVCLWMWLIFTASGDKSSGQRSSRIIGPFLTWLFPTMSEETRGHVVLGVRKCAHLTEYAILAMLLWRALRKPQRNDPRPWSWRIAAIALFCSVIYATSDEVHQTFVPSRTGQWIDVVIDTFGAAMGLLLLWAWTKWRSKRVSQLTD